MKSQDRELKKLLREAGLRVTQNRLAVMQMLRKRQKPVTVQDVIAGLKSIAPDQVTIYRILRSLVEADLVREVYVTKGVSSYELADRPHHHHLICEKCGFVEDVHDCCDNPKPANTSFKTITHHNLEFMGICENCAEA